MPRIARPLWPTANRPSSSSPARTVKRTRWRERGSMRTIASLAGGRQLVEHGVGGEAVALDLRVARLAEAREVDAPPIDLADLGEALGDRLGERAHRELQAYVLLGEVAAVAMVADQHHDPGAAQEVAAVGQQHLAVEHPVDAALAPVQAADHHVLPRVVPG